MDVIYSKTGSDGNCSILRGKNSQYIIDCGIGYKKIDKAIGYELFQSDGIFITHHHGDHMAHIKDFNKLGIEIYVNKETSLKPPLNGYANVVLLNDEQLSVKDFIVKPFSLVHTSHSKDENSKTVIMPCECTGFLFYEKDTKEKLLWITDTAYVKNVFPPVEYICVECNYIDTVLTEEYLKENNAFVEQRRFGSHMSLNTCINFLKAQDLSKCKQIRLLHLSNSLDSLQKKYIYDTIKLSVNGIEVI